MLRRRRGIGTSLQPADDPDTKKPQKKRPNVQSSLRDVWSAWVIVLLAAIRPAPDIRSEAYSRFLTGKVYKLTIGWHIFRAVTEGIFLFTHLFSYDTIVVQLFWSMTLASVLLHFTARSKWLRWREAICVGTNLVYALVTVGKIYHLVPRLPNENNYLFKHCFLTMADAFFSQTPVHKQYMAQFVDAVVRCVVWKRYRVLPDVPMAGVATVSLTWQLWLVTFSALLQARHTAAFAHEQGQREERQRSTDQPGQSGQQCGSGGALPRQQSQGDASCASVLLLSTSGSVSSASAAAGAAAAAAGEPSLLDSHASVPPSTLPESKIVGTAAVCCAGASVQSLAPAAAASDMSSAKAAEAHAQAGSAAHLARASLPTGAYSLLPARASNDCSSGEDGVASRASHRASTSDAQVTRQRYMRALRSVARGPSSYVLLTHQRRQQAAAGGLQTASAQLVVTAASPDMLSPEWRARLATAVAEGAPGWQIANACVRKGSLIVHLDLVYAPQAHAEAAMATAEASPRRASRLGPQTQPRYVVPTAPTQAGQGPEAPASGPTKVLEDYLDGMNAERLMELLGLPPEPELELWQQNAEGADAGLGPSHGGGDAAAHKTANVVSVQLGDVVRRLPKASDEPTKPVSQAATAAPTASVPDVETEAGPSSSISPSIALAPASGLDASTSSLTPTSALTEVRALGVSLAKAVCTALAPPPAMSSIEYAAFLSARVGPLHAAYAFFLVITAVAFYSARAGSGVHLVTIVLFCASEVLSVVGFLAHWRQGPGGRGAPRTGWGSMGTLRARLVYAGVVLRTLQMAACTTGLMPHALDSDCASGRWMQRVMLITTLQAVCMQLPVRSFFALRLPSALLVMHVHIAVCKALAPAVGVVLHLCWEALLFVFAAYRQLRHVEAFYRSRNTSGTGRVQPDPCDSTSKRLTANPAAATTLKAATAGAKVGLRCCGNQCSCGCLAGFATCGCGCEPAESTTTAAHGHADGAPSAQVQAGVAGTPLVTAPQVCRATEGAEVSDVRLSSSAVAIKPRRAAKMQLQFTCCLEVVDRLQVVVRHVGPAAVAGGLHGAHTPRDIMHALAAPPGAAASQPGEPCTFNAEITLVAAPADMPGLVIVELWCERRRLASRPALLAPAPGAEGTAAGATDESEADWLQDFTAYVRDLETEGHSAAADQFIEEVGGWLAQVEAVDRGLMAAADGGPSGSAASGAVMPPRIANVLYFHGYGGDPLYLKPSCATQLGAANGIRSSYDAGGCSGALRQLLLSEGAMLLAVAVEAGCVALSRRLAAVLTGPLRAHVRDVVGAARTPVTQLPLLHAATKSGCPEMVDLVAAWSGAAGLSGAAMWGAEAAVLAFGLEGASCSSSIVGGLVPESAEGLLQSLLPERETPDLCGEGMADVPKKRQRAGLKSADPGAAISPVQSFTLQRRDVHLRTATPTAAATALSGRVTRRDSSSHSMDPARDDDCDSIATDADEMETPFKVISFLRAAQAPTAGGAGASLDGGRDTAVQQVPREAMGGPGAAGARPSNELFDGRVIVVTPLHLCLALGDEGCLAEHIFRTYPEAHELWRLSTGRGWHPHLEPLSSVASASDCGCDPRAGGLSSVLAAEMSAASSAGVAGSTGRLAVMLQDASGATMVHSLGSSNGNVLGLGYSGKGSGPGTRTAPKVAGAPSAGVPMGITDEDDCSGTSLSLGDVASFEGFRMLEEEAPSKRQGFNVVSLPVRRPQAGFSNTS